MFVLFMLKRMVLHLWKYSTRPMRELCLSNVFVKKKKLSLHEEIKSTTRGRRYLIMVIGPSGVFNHTSDFEGPFLSLVLLLWKLFFSPPLDMTQQQNTVNY